MQALTQRQRMAALLLGEAKNFSEDSVTTEDRLYWYLLGAADEYGYVSVDQYRLERLLFLYRNEFEYWMQRLEGSGRIDRVVGHLGGNGGSLYRVREEMLGLSRGKERNRVLSTPQVPTVQEVWPRGEGGGENNQD